MGCWAQARGKRDPRRMLGTGLGQERPPLPKEGMSPEDSRAGLEPHLGKGMGPAQHWMFDFTSSRHF